MVNLATKPQIVIGSKMPVSKTVSSAGGGGSGEGGGGAMQVDGNEKLAEEDVVWISAEVLGIRFADTDAPEYYVHYDQYNKRLDEWVKVGRMDTTKIKQPSPKKKAPVVQKKGPFKKTPSTLDRRMKANKGLTPQAQGTPSAPSSSSTPQNLLETPAPGDNEEGDSTQNSATAADQEEEAAAAIFSKEKELEKLRTSGSMTQSQAEISRLKNINKICIGKSIIDTWYFAPYPEEFTKLDVLHICEFCLEPVGSEQSLARHRSKCNIRHPPGNEIYRCDTLSFFEIDGRKQRHYCRNLCLISKLFLDHKTLYYEVDPFLYYIMTRNDERGMHLIGYFSKEKSSAENYNVACILTLPQYQRKGYGKLLISFSYELSKVEQKLGSPEKPLSDLGLLSYRSYWADIIIDLLMNCKSDQGMSIQEISEATSFTSDDIMHTIQSIDILRYYRSNYVMFLDEKSCQSYQKNQKKKREKIDPSKLDWSPPKFLASQLTFL